MSHSISKELGSEWAPAVLNSMEEVDFIRAAQRGFGREVNYLVGGIFSGI